MQFWAVLFEVQCSVFMGSVMHCNLGSVQLNELYPLLVSLASPGLGQFSSIGLLQHYIYWARAV